MTIVRSLYFCNSTAFNIQMTKHHMYELKERLGDELPTWVFENVLGDLTDLEYLVSAHDQDEWMPDLHTENLIPRSTWFLRYGIRDPTFEFFNGDDDDTVHTFDITDLSDDDSTIDSVDEIMLIGSGRANDPIDLTDDDLEDLDFD